MSEAEYVHAIRNAAQRYLDVVRDPAAHHSDGQQRIRRWEAIKEKISPITLIALCDAWFAARNGQNKPVVGE